MSPNSHRIPQLNFNTFFNTFRKLQYFVITLRMEGNDEIQNIIYKIIFNDLLPATIKNQCCVGLLINQKVIC